MVSRPTERGATHHLFGAAAVKGEDGRRRVSEGMGGQEGGPGLGEGKGLGSLSSYWWERGR